MAPNRIVRSVLVAVVLVVSDAVCALNLCLWAASRTPDNSPRRAIVLIRGLRAQDIHLTSPPQTTLVQG